MRKIIVLSIGLMLWTASISFAYMDNYPPYKFKDGSPKHLEAENLVGSDKAEYKSRDGQIIAKLKDTEDSPYFILQEGNTVLVRINKKELPFPYAVYRADLDGNGLNDFIIFYWEGGAGLGANQDKVEVFLKKKTGSYQRIVYETLSAGIEDFIGPDKEGKYKIIITGFYQGDKHNYFTYDLYQFEDFRLINANAKVKGFPRFVEYTCKNND